jgi:hypothetical protein
MIPAVDEFQAAEWSGIGVIMVNSRLTTIVN